jgi:hypothetical protein
MKARNRKYQAAAVRFGPALKAFALCLFLGGSGLGYVWQIDQIHKLGDELKRAEHKYERLHRQNEVRSQVLAALQSQAELEARIKQMNLGLVAPEPDQIVRLVETLPAPFVPGGGSPDMRHIEQPPRLLACP